MEEKTNQDERLPAKSEPEVYVPEVLEDTQENLPGLLVGAATPELKDRLGRFYSQIAEIFEAWVARRGSPHTQRAYRADVMRFVEWRELEWPRDAAGLLEVSVPDVQSYRDELRTEGKAPSTIHRRLCSLSSFYKFLAASAAELRLPVNIPNPAHSQFIPRESTDPVNETKALSVTLARKLQALPEGDDVFAARDRAIINFYMYSACRIGTGCRLQVADFHQDEDGSTMRVREKGGKRRTIGLHFRAADSIREYLEASKLQAGALFRARKRGRSKSLSDRAMSPVSMWRLLQSYLNRLPRAMKSVELPDGTVVRRPLYTPHSLRATAATVLLDSGVDIMDVKELLGHQHVTTTQIYDKRRKATKDSASHEIPI